MKRTEQEIPREGAPYRCECCGAPLDPRLDYCRYCQVHFKPIRRYEGPPMHVWPGGLLSGSISVSSCCVITSTSQAYATSIPAWSPALADFEERAMYEGPREASWGS